MIGTVSSTTSSSSSNHNLDHQNRAVTFKCQMIATVCSAQIKFYPIIIYVFFVVSHADDLSKAIQGLVALVKLLRDDIAYQRGEIGHLRGLIESCYACKEHAQPVQENCQNANPCFPGVQCYDNGAASMRCGHCPRGYIGDGKMCTPGITCADRPCYQWVHIFVFLFWCT